jgi:NAD(P)-dependent dehydrogenase (short-subunit alcohol dehydrogenase family)
MGEARSLASLSQSSTSRSPLGVEVQGPPIAQRSTASVCESLGSMSPSIALVTGATGGIGKEIARQLATLGWTVLVGARDPGRGEEVATEVGGQSLLLDVTDPAGIAAAAASVPELDVLVNNAGISLDIGSLITETDIDVFRRTYETNVFGVLTVTNAFVPQLHRSAHPRIVNISSGTGSLTWSTGPSPQFDFRLAGNGRLAAYRSSKTALNALTVFYAQALANDRIKVNALAPSLRATNLNSQAAAAGGDPGEGAAGAVRLAVMADDGPTGQLFSWDGTVVPW